MMTENPVERGLPAGPSGFFTAFFAFWCLIMFTSLLQIAISAFYLTHIVKNRKGSDLLRILCGIGAFYLPYVALPAYFLIYIWPENAPEWALQKSASEG